MVAGPIDIFNPEVRECQEGYYWDDRVKTCIRQYTGDNEFYDDHGQDPNVNDGRTYDDDQIIGEGQGQLDVESATLLQDQFNQFWNQYMPVADYMQNRLTPETALPEQVAQTAREGAMGAGLAGAAQAGRGVSRYGADISGTRQQSMNRNLSLTGAAGVAGAGTTAYRSMYDTNLASAADFISLGHGAKGEGLSGTLAANANTQNRLSAQYGMNMQTNNAVSAANMQVGLAGASAVGSAFMV